MPINKDLYVYLIGELYEKIPKSVFASIVISSAMKELECSIDNRSLELMKSWILKEWLILHENRIIKEHPNKVL